MKVKKATPEVIEAWRAEAEAQGAEWILVIHDEFLDEDYPAFYEHDLALGSAREFLEERADKTIVAEVRV